MPRPRRTILSVSFAMLLLFGLASTYTAHAQEPKCEPGKVASKYPELSSKKVLIGVDPQSPPYVFRDPNNFERLIGLEADLARKVFECAGVAYEFSMGAWSGLLPAVMAGQVDVMWASLFYLPERAKKLDFVAYMQAGLGALVQKGNPKNIKSAGDLCGHVVSALVGTVEETTLRKQDATCRVSGGRGIDIQLSPDTAASLRQLLSGRADVFLINLGAAQDLAKDRADQVSFGFTVLTGAKQAAAVPNGREDLLHAIYDGLRIAQKDGSQRELSKKYGVDPQLEIPVEILRE